jgi:hypothetical protein
MSLSPLTLDIPTVSYKISDTEHRFLTLFYIFTFIAQSLLAPYNINIAKKVLLLIKTSGDPLFANGNMISDNTYVEEGTSEPNGLEARLS